MMYDIVAEQVCGPANDAVKLVEKASAGGFAYEYSVLLAIKNAGIRGNIATPAGANAGAPDADITIDGRIFPVEVKMDRGAQMGGSSIRWSYGERRVSFVTDVDPVVKSIINKTMASKVNVLTDFVDFVREYDGNEDFNGWPGQLTRESWDAAQQQGVLAPIQTRIPHDVSFIASHYARKGIHYIQIGGAGLFFLSRNPARLPIPKLTGSIEIEIRAARNSTTIRKRDGLAVVGSGLRVQARLKAKGESPYTLDSSRSIREMLIVRRQRESLIRNLTQLFPVVTF